MKLEVLDASPSMFGMHTKAYLKTKTLLNKRTLLKNRDWMYPRNETGILLTKLVY